MRAPVCAALLLLCALSGAAARRFSEEQMAAVRQRIRSMFYHAYNSYLSSAFPYDELRPLTCDGQDTWGSFSLTLIDALDTLLVLGNRTEFQRVALLLQDTVDFDIDVNASVFETNIRGEAPTRFRWRPGSDPVLTPVSLVVGGLLSAHLLAGRAGMQLEPGWPCSGPLLRMAEDAARKLLPAFATPSGMPFGTVNLRRGVSPGETPVTCTAGVGTFILEFAALSRLTGDAAFEAAARRALAALWSTRSDIGLVGNHIDIVTRKWVAQDAGIGAGVDSYFEYLVKGAILLQDQELLSMFRAYDQAIQNYTRFDDWYLWVQMNKGTVTMPVFQSLEAFWPGLQSLLGNLDGAARTFQNYYSVWRQFGGLPEFYSITQGYTVDKREGYPLRPELMESAMYLFRATGDHTYLQFGLDAVESIERIAKTPCGYASVKDLRDHQLDNRMESFFLAETIKYLYLLFDPAHFLHGGGSEGDGSWEGGGAGGGCVLGAGGFIFNTEAHPLDPAALHCCSRQAQERRELQQLLLGLTAPGGQSERPDGQSERPGQSQRPDGQSERPGQSQRPNGQSERPGQSQRPDGQSERPDGQSERPGQSQRPNGQSERPGQSQRPNGQSERPNDQSERPNSQSQRPDGQSERPDGQSQRPNGQSQRPNGQSQRPNGQSQRPGQSDRPGQSERPNGQSERPNSQSERPNGQSQQPAGQSERPNGQSERPGAQTEDPPPSQSESIALKPGERKAPPPLSCPVQPFGARLAVLGQVFSDDT